MKIELNKKFEVALSVWDIGLFRLKKGDVIEVVEITSLLTAFIRQSYIQPTEVTFEALRIHCKEI